MSKENRDARSDAQADKDLFKATLPFGVESVKTSWWVVGSTFVLLLASLAGAALAPAWPLRLLFSVSSAMLMVRAFITYPRPYAQRDIVTVSSRTVVVSSVLRTRAHAATILEEQPQ